VGEEIVYGILVGKPRGKNDNIETDLEEVG
jgi:hypothetical protein